MVITTSSVSDQWFWRVWICCLIDVDIPRLSSDGIIFDTDCFLFTYSLQSSSTYSSISSSFDASGLANYISFGNKVPPTTSTVVKNRTQLNSIPLDVKDLWISLFYASIVTEFSPGRFQSLKTLVIGNGLFWSVKTLEFNIPSLQSLYIGNGCCFLAPSFSLTGLIDGLVWIHRSSSTSISQNRRKCIP